MSEVGAFFQDDFLCQLNKAFPNLETYNVDYGKLIEKLPYPQRFWCLRTLTSVLDSLSSVKNLNFPSMDLALIALKAANTIVLQMFSVFNIWLENFGLFSDF